LKQWGGSSHRLGKIQNVSFDLRAFPRIQKSFQALIGALKKDSYAKIMAMSLRKNQLNF